MNLYSEWLLNGQPSVIELAGIAPEARWMIPRPAVFTTEGTPYDFGNLKG